MSEIKETIKRLFALILERVEYLKEIAQRFPTVNSYKRAGHIYKAATERDLQVVIEACIDIGKIIISEKRLPPPQSMREICELLFKNRFINERVFRSLLKMVGMRNILVHRYEKIDDEIVYSVIKKHLKDFEDFINQISRHLLKSLD